MPDPTAMGWDMGHLGSRAGPGGRKRGKEEPQPWGTDCVGEGRGSHALGEGGGE